MKVNKNIKNLKKVAKTIGKGAESLVLEVTCRAFAFGFKHGTYAYYWYTRPYGNKDDADRYLSKSYDKFIEVVDEWFETASANREAKSFDEEKLSELSDHIFAIEKAMWENDGGYGGTYSEMTILDNVYERVSTSKRYGFQDIHDIKMLERKYLPESERWYK